MIFASGDIHRYKIEICCTKGGKIDHRGVCESLPAAYGWVSFVEQVEDRETIFANILYIEDGEEVYCDSKLYDLGWAKDYMKAWV